MDAPPLEIFACALPSNATVIVRPLSLCLKTTVPVGVPAPGEVAATVAVKITDWPKTDGLVLEVSVGVVSDLLTCWVKVEERLVLKLESPR